MGVPGQGSPRETSDRSEVDTTHEGWPSHLNERKVKRGTKIKRNIKLKVLNKKLGQNHGPEICRVTLYSMSHSCHEMRESLSDLFCITEKLLGARQLTEKSVLPSSLQMATEKRP